MTLDPSRPPDVPSGEVGSPRPMAGDPDAGGEMANDRSLSAKGWSAWSAAAVPATPPPGPAPGIAWAGVWRRIGACLLDWVLVFAVAAVGIALAGGADVTSRTVTVAGGSAATTTVSVNARGMLVVGLVAQAYFSVAWAVAGRTLGQAAVRVSVHRLDDGGRPRPLQAGARAAWFAGPWLLGALSPALWLLGMVVAAVGLLVAAWEPRRRGWHDMCAGTVAVRPWP
jgi:uncharacterized RDD family membrane protein YckC